MMKSKYFLLALGFCSLLGLCACNSPYIPKPRGYFKVEMPAKTYQVFDQPGYPYQFEFPTYAQVVQDTTFFENKPENPWWINIDFPQFNARVHISYKALQSNNFDQLVADAFNLTYKHTYKASSIDDSAFTNQNQVSGIYFKVGGNAATANQFFVTDSTKHFLRGALYFDTTPNEDSLAPMNQYLQQDLLHLIQTLKWKNATGNASQPATLANNFNN